MSRKRTGLSGVLGTSSKSPRRLVEAERPTHRERPKVVSGKRPGIRQQTAYLPEPVYQQLRELAYEEEAENARLLMEGLDMVFKQKGLRSIDELTGKQD